MKRQDARDAKKQEETVTEAGSGFFLGLLHDRGPSTSTCLAFFGASVELF